MTLPLKPSHLGADRERHRKSRSRDSGRDLRPSLVGLSVYPASNPDNGGKSRIFHLARGCAQRFDVTYFSQSFSPAALRSARWSAVSDSYREYIFLDPASAMSHLSARTLRVPELLQSRVYDFAIPRWMRDAVAQADIVVVEQPWLFAWAKRQRAGRPLVYDAHNVESTMFENIRCPLSLRRAITAEIVHQERNAVVGSDIVLSTSDDDATTLISQYEVSQTRIEVVPNGVDCTLIQPVVKEERNATKARLGFGGKRILLFCGSRHPPNTEAVQQILACASQSEERDLHFLIVGSVGRSFPDESRHNVTFTGFVEDVRPYLAAADVAVNPMLSGSGTNLKQVEYLAAGIPSITTGVGARGLGLVDGETALIRKPPEILSADALLRANESLAQRISVAGRALAFEKFDWGRIASRLLPRYDALLASRTVAAAMAPPHPR